MNRIYYLVQLHHFLDVIPISPLHLSDLHGGLPTVHLRHIAVHDHYVESTWFVQLHRFQPIRCESDVHLAHKLRFTHGGQYVFSIGFQWDSRSHLFSMEEAFQHKAGCDIILHH